jgi:hypothetical protein
MLVRGWGELVLESINNQSCSPSFRLQSKTLKHHQHIQYAQASFTAFSSVPQFNTGFFTFHKPPAKMQLSTPFLLSLLTILSTLHPTIRLPHRSLHLLRLRLHRRPNGQHRFRMQYRRRLQQVREQHRRSLNRHRRPLRPRCYRPVLFAMQHL